MSKKKGQQKKEIVSAFAKAPFWEYKSPTAEKIEKADTFLATFAAQLKALIDPAKSFQGNYEVLADKMGYEVHPCLVFKEKKESQFPALLNSDYGQKYVIFMGHKIDIVTLKLFGFLLSNYKINSLKISNNNLHGQQALQIKRILDKQDGLASLFFQWNSLEGMENRKQIILSTVRPSLQHLILRECKMGNQICKQLFAKIKGLPQLKLKSLDLYGNLITTELKDDICNLVEQSKTLQFIGLSKNALNDEEFITKLFNSIGQVPLSEQEFEQHKLKEKVRDEILEKNKKKKKGSPDEPVPLVFEVKETQNGRFYVKNTSLKVLNLSNNGLKDGLGGLIRSFVEKQGRNVELFIEGNKFSKKTKEDLKYHDNLIV